MKQYSAKKLQCVDEYFLHLRQVKYLNFLMDFVPRETFYNQSFLFLILPDFAKKKWIFSVKKDLKFQKNSKPLFFTCKGYK